MPQPSSRDKHFVDKWHIRFGNRFDRPQTTVLAKVTLSKDLSSQFSECVSISGSKFLVRSLLLYEKRQKRKLKSSNLWKIFYALQLEITKFNSVTLTWESELLFGRLAVTKKLEKENHLTHQAQLRMSCICKAAKLNINLAWSHDS